MPDGKLSKEQKKANKKMARGRTYDHARAKELGYKRDETGHLPSRDTETGRVLKGKKHPTYKLAKKVDKKLGYKHIRGGDKRIYSVPKGDKSMIKTIRGLGK
jgi:hypothetical protein